MGWAGLAWIALVLAGAEVLRRRQTNPEWVRKFVHIGIGNIILLAWGLNFSLGLCLTFCLPFVGLTLLSYRLPILQSINGVGRQSLGTFYYALSISLLVFFFWENSPQVTTLGVLVMTWGDALAAIVGQQWGRHPYELAGIRKTWEGSLVMAFVSSLVCWGVLGFHWSVFGIAVGIGTVAAGLEIFSWDGIDNLTVPLGSALLAWWWISLPHS